MPKKKLSPPPLARKPRADAQRNRERILEVAKEVFTRDGAAASLDDIVRQAGVGAGTLYRHFPTRDALIEAVYRSEVERLAAAEQRFAAKMPPLEALRAWMLLFIDHVAAKTLIIPAMDTVAGGSMRLIEGSRSLIHTAFVASVKRAVASGDLRSDTDPNDFVRALVGIFHTTALPGWEPSARRLVDILIAGSRAVSKRASTPSRVRRRASRKVREV
ncbi:TetR family transcriptional regulator [Granulicella sp. 5B5]|uniref:TetR/AcrR family transcriptional regulator n=1 Tax=Granulicella sp. 5B5 TaxID=1617967 RepID=UPI0015F3E50A|nr:TetR/AcrR family transcriptional regulator [Granulicella sp. 5B5]QMV18163.1 TetR family transcriptional regulator [Granulicella sp. 5B5]